MARKKPITLEEHLAGIRGLGGKARAAKLSPEELSAIGRLAVDEFLKGNADEVYLVYTDFINMVRQARHMGLQAPFPIFAPLSKHPYMIGELKDDAAGMYYAAEYSMRVNTPENQDMIRRYHEKHKDDKDFLTQWPFSDVAMAILGWKMTFAAIEKAGSLDAEKIIEAYEGFQWKSPVGMWTMRKCDHQVVLPMFGGIIEAGPNPYYKFPWASAKVEEFPADKVTLPATKDYNNRCQ